MACCCGSHNAPVIQEYGWDDEARFVAENGVVDEVTRQSTATTEGHYIWQDHHNDHTGAASWRDCQTDEHAARLLDQHSAASTWAFTSLITRRSSRCSQMPDDIGSDYGRWKRQGKGIVAFGGHDALGSYLQACLLYPYAPWMPKTIGSNLKNESYTPPAYADDRILPHHEWLAEYAAQGGHGAVVGCLCTASTPRPTTSCPMSLRRSPRWRRSGMA